MKLMSDLELLESYRDYDAEEDIGDTATPGHVAGSYGIFLADKIF